MRRILKNPIGGKRSGVTFIEIMMVLLIASIVFVGWYRTMSWTRHRAMLAVFMSDIRQVKIAAGRFQTDVGVYPPDVNRGVDPGMIDKFGWQNGGHSSKWNLVNLSGWKGPYLAQWKTWKRNPWGGLYDWDNYEPGYNYMGITGGAVYLTLKPSTWGGKDGLPKPKYEDILEELGLDTSPWESVISVRMGHYPNTNQGLGGGH